ncbi:hypothetical protein PR003_g234 [Phytophthora rubi]|uniref:Uncharacterized protein n=1 Tax=Phytophthora rubi TaxID=129364 RepID=A0A6A4G5W3_9STRA|nr:hypothetical protein PR003_g234 [Phytophthora rubi]
MGALKIITIATLALTATLKVIIATLTRVSGFRCFATLTSWDFSCRSDFTE